MNLHQRIHRQRKLLTRSPAFNVAMTLTGLFLLVAFVTNQTDATADRRTSAEPDVTRIGFAVIAEGSAPFGYRTRQGQMIAGTDQWTALWQALHLTTIPQPPVPEVDFARQVVLVIFAGEKRGSGYMVFVREIVQTDDAVIVKVAEQRAMPANDSEPQPAYPFQIVTMPRSKLPVLFSFQSSS
jgi:hypothetical protein